MTHIAHQKLMNRADEVVHALRTAIDAINAVYMPIPPEATDDDISNKTDQDDAMVQRALTKLGNDLALAEDGSTVVRAAIRHVLFVRGPRARTMVYRDQLTVRSVYDNGQPNGIEVRANIEK